VADFIRVPEAEHTPVQAAVCQQVQEEVCPPDLEGDYLLGPVGGFRQDQAVVYLPDRAVAFLPVLVGDFTRGLVVGCIPDHLRTIATYPQGKFISRI
jgi:hypothetical protein